MTFLSPLSLHTSASSMAARMAWALSGAGMMHSDFENCTAASNVATCLTVRGSMSPCSTIALTLGAVPW